MDSIVFLILRRMRRPLLTLIIVYSVAILGLTLIPGKDADGNTWYMGIFHAFYFVSYTATTIGFGELPHEFSDAQRLWVTFSLYASVISWFYAIGTIISLVQNTGFQHALSEYRFSHQIRSLCEPFYLVCGYGETGSALIKTLTDNGQHAVAIEIDEYRSNLIRLDNLRDYVPVLHADARVPRHLQEAGLQHPMCKAVVALTNVNESNLKIAISSKLLHPRIDVICRADSHDVEANMASFGTDHIIDPFDTFAIHLSTALQTPCLYLLQRWLSGEHGVVLTEPVYPPREKFWVVCGYGRFGKAVCNRLKQEGVNLIVIEAAPERTGEPEDGYVKGRGTEAETLIEAGIERAAGLIAGTDDDANNLSIIMTAREINPDLFVVARQNLIENTAIFDAAQAEMVMHPSTIIADKIRVLLATPMLYEFISLAYGEDNQWACQLISRITGLVRSTALVVNEFSIDQETAPAAYKLLVKGKKLTIGKLLCDPLESDHSLGCIFLLMIHHDSRTLLPDLSSEINIGDKFLICSKQSNATRLQRSLQDESTLDYIRTDGASRRGWLWKKLGL